MISAEDGYNKIIKQHVMDRLTTVLDFGKFYVYFFKPINMSDDEVNLSGTMFDAIDKENGKHFMYDLLSDYDAYENAKVIDIKDIYSMRVDELDRHK